MFSLSDFFSFEKYLTPTVIKIVYFIGLIVIALATLVGFLGGLFSFTFTGIIGALLVLVGGAVGILWWRVIIETTIIFFGIVDRLAEIRDRLPPR
jgi:hypothetical protein